jgi:hypothetical protein
MARYNNSPYVQDIAKMIFCVSGDTGLGCELFIPAIQDGNPTKPRMQTKDGQPVVKLRIGSATMKDSGKGMAQSLYGMKSATADQWALLLPLIANALKQAPVLISSVKVAGPAPTKGDQRIVWFNDNGNAVERAFSLVPIGGMFIDLDGTEWATKTAPVAKAPPVPMPTAPRPPVPMPSPVLIGVKQTGPTVQTIQPAVQGQPRQIDRQRTARLADPSQWSVAELKAALKAEGLPVGGNKATLYVRYTEANS